MLSIRLSVIQRRRVAVFHHYSAECNSDHWILVHLLSSTHQGVTYRFVLCVFHPDLGFPFRRRPKVWFKQCYQCCGRAERSRIYPRWRLQLPWSAVSSKLAEIMITEKLGSLSCIWEHRLMLLRRQEGARLREPDFTCSTSEFLIKKKKDLWIELIHFMCCGSSLLLWQWFLGNNAAGFLAVTSSQGFINCFWTWRSVDSGLLPKLHILVYVLYWCFCVKSTLHAK